MNRKPDPAIVSALSTQLSWSHFIARQNGKQILATASQGLTTDQAIVVTLSRQIIPSHFRASVAA